MSVARQSIGAFVLLIQAIVLVLVQPVLSSFHYELQPRTDTSPYALRVMPLGASITAGRNSVDGNGYRQWLWDQLRDQGWDVDMVGSMHNGTMEDNDHEGHNGYRIDQLTRLLGKSSSIEKVFDLQPNVILLNLGTNDVIQEYQISTAGDRIDTLMTYLFDTVPGTTIILSTLLPCTIHPTLIDEINSQYRALASRQRADGKRVILADMDRFIGVSQLGPDGIHPTYMGYKVMASVWFSAIESAEQADMIPSPKVASYQAMTTPVPSVGAHIFRKLRWDFPLLAVVHLVVCGVA
ncbi:hypothetical protein FE257_004916 [Aspergillus nanangensis]|uniref:SGNH hydrolase-type esterase domain-containing protein n=1 Tax=Aspergillus nanangensis TaxID=2582783 RepID=A0AAD4CBS9_ASPNN|nr:hypothetical protein FE257_004916 [Aspergillus nanangensis]